MPDFVKQYEELEECFKKQVERDRFKCDDIVYVPPFTRPSRQVDYVLIAMEPALTKKWAGNHPNRKDGEAAVKKGYRSFMPGSLGVCILHYCAKKYLCTGGQTYYITDMSKGAMPPPKANSDREKRWEEWFRLLKKELELVAKKDATVFAIGRDVENFLTEKWVQGEFDYKPIYLLHHSDTNAKARKKYVDKRKPEFKNFKRKVTEKDLKDFASALLFEDGTEWAVTESKKRLEEQKLSDSRKMLIFCYKNTFEGCRRNKQLK